MRENNEAKDPKQHPHLKAVKDRSDISPSALIKRSSGDAVRAEEGAPLGHPRDPGQATQMCRARCL